MSGFNIWHIRLATRLKSKIFVCLFVSVSDLFWSRVSPFYQLFWYPHTRATSPASRLHSDFVGFDMHAESLCV